MKKPTLDTLANIVILVTGAVALITIGYRMWWVPSRHQNIQRPPAYSVGERLNTGRLIDYSRAAHNVLVSIHTSCPHCETVIPFLRDMTENLPGGARLLVVGTEQDSVLRKYLDDRGLVTLEVITVPEGAFKIRNVPTILIADAEGRYVKSWTGRLDESRQALIRAALRPADS